jgi:4-amino-4-deoxy-L-arabinose transferase-like glycosyltransferase
MKVNFEESRFAFGALAVIVVLAMAFRLFLMQWRFAIGFDEPHYLQIAASAVLRGWQEVLHPYWPPMYPICIALIARLVPDFELAGRLVSLIMGSLVLLPVFFLAQALFDKKTALAAVLLLALFPPLAFGATDALSESTYTFLATSGVAVGWLALQKRSVWRGFGAGLIFALAYLTKPEGLGYLLVFLSLASLAFMRNLLLRQNKKITLIAVAALAGFAIGAFPYLSYLHRLTGKWMLSAKWDVNQYDMDAINNLSPDDMALPVDMAYHAGNFHEYKSDHNHATNGHLPSPAALAGRVVKNFYRALRFAIPAILTAPLFVLLTLGLFGERWDWSQTKLNGYLLAFIGFFWLVVIPFFHINDRYLIPLLPICFIWIGRGALRLHAWLRNWIGTVQQNFSKRPFAADKLGQVIFLFFLLFFSFLPELGKVVSRNPVDGEFWEDAVELKAAGKWIRDNSTEEPLIMSYNKAVDFYAGVYDIRRTASFSNDSIDRILKYAIHKGVTHIVIDERYLERFPNLADLFDPIAAPQALELLHAEMGLSGHRVFVYRLCKRSNHKG